MTVYFDGKPQEGPKPVLSCNGKYLYDEYVNLTYKDERGMMSNKPYTKIGKYTLSYHYKGNKTYATTSRSFYLKIILPPEE